MNIHHIAILCEDLEKIKAFYCRYFGCIAGNKYINDKNGFESYFLHFEDGARIELMKKAWIIKVEESPDSEYIGLAHIAISTGSVENVDHLTEILRSHGYEVITNPRRTGEGCYESPILDPDGNRVEITV